MKLVEKPSNSFDLIRIQEEILAHYAPEQQLELKKRMSILSSIVYFIGQDFEIDIELNKPGKGWHWDFKDNIVRVDPEDLLNRPIEYSCYVMAHEAGHRRVSRTHFIPQETWNMPGFSFLMNAIEDPRENNFVADNYPMFAKRLQVAFDEDWDIEQKTKEIAQERISKCPRFMEAGYEYIRLWFIERLNTDEFKNLTKEQATKKLRDYVREDILPEVRQVVLDTLDVARESWWLYPTKKEADSPNGEQIISDFAEGSYIINLEDIWPIFKTLIDQDIQDEKTKQMMDELQKQKQESNPDNKKQEKDSRSKSKGQEQEQKKDSQKQKGDGKNPEENEIESQQEQTSSGEGESLKELTEEELQKMLDEMSDEERKELEQKAQAQAEKIIKELADDVAKQMQGKLNQDPNEQMEESKESMKEGEEDVQKKTEEVEKEKEERKNKQERESKKTKEIADIKKRLQELADKDLGRYEKDRREVAEMITVLTNDLRSVFYERRKTKTQTGFKTGRSVDIKKRITEIARGVSPLDSRAWIKKEKPTEKDYAISVLVDLSGSMRSGQKIEETFKAVIVLSEVLHNLGISFNVKGFNDRLIDFVKFGQTLDGEKRRFMEQMIREVDGSRSIGNPRYNDDGWAVQQMSEELSSQKQSEKILFVLSDGKPEPSSIHSGSEFDLSKIVQKIEREGTQSIIGLGLGEYTGHVADFYKKRNIANIPVQQLPKKLAQLLKDIIEK